MNYGSFYFVDKQASRQSEGVIVFRYNRIVDKNTDNESYPISLYITNNAAIFYLTHRKVHTAEVFRINFHTTPHNLSNRNSINCLYGQELDNDNKYQIKSLGKSVYFSSLSVFDKKTEEPDKHDTKIKAKDIFLDFLYDFCHTSVFRSTKTFDHLYLTVSQDFYLQAIIKKANFYYYRELLNEKENEEKETKDIIRYLRLKFDDAETDWVRTIRDSRIDDFSNESNAWLNAPENELSAVYFCNDTKIKHPNCVQFFPKQNYKSHNEIKQSSVWSMERCYFRGATGMPKIYLRIVYVLLAVFWAFFFITTYLPKWEIMPKISFWIGASLALGLLLFFGFLVFQKNKGKATSSYVFGTHLFMPQLVAAIVTAWLTIGLNGVLFKAFYDASSSLKWLNVIFFTGIILFSLYYQIGRVIPYAKWYTILIRASVLYFISFFITVVTGFMLIHFTSDKFLRTQVFSKEYMSSIVMDKSEASDYLKTWYNQLTIDYYYDRYNSAEAWTELITPLEDMKRIDDNDRKEALKYINSFGTNSDDYAPVLRELPFNLTVLWNYLFLFSFFVMFIGIFLQMISQNKSVTSHG